MRKFIWKVVQFILLPLIIIFTFDIILRSQNSLYKEKYVGAMACNDSIEVLILGNSHANYGVDPGAFDMYAYNLANVQQSIYFDKRITLSLLPYCKNVKYVLISIDYHSLYFSSQQMRNIWSYYGNGIKYKDSNFLLADISPFLFGYTPKVSVSILKKKVLNRLIYGKNILDFDVENGVNLKDSLVKGFISYENFDSKSFTEEMYQSRANSLKPKNPKFGEKKEVYEDLVDFIENLLELDITPIFFTTPTYKEYNKYLDTIIIYDNLKDIEILCKNGGLTYWDFMESSEFEKDNFYNGDHLNKSGAYKFAKILNDSLLKLHENRHIN